MWVKWKKQTKTTVQLTAAYIGFPKQQNSACWLKIDQNILTRFHVQSTFELYRNIKCHTLKLTLFVHCKLQSIIDWREKHVCDDFDRRVQLQTRHFLWVADFDRHFWVMKTSTKRMSMGKSGPTTAPVKSLSKNLTTRQLICAQMVAQKQLCIRFVVCCHAGLQIIAAWEKPFSIARDVIWIAHGNSIIVGRSVSDRGTVKWSTAKWVLQLHQSIIWRWRSSKIRSIKIHFLNIVMIIII